MIPCEQQGAIAEIRADVSHLREWEAKQNGSLCRLTEEMGNVRLAAARLEEQVGHVNAAVQEIRDGQVWMRRLLYTTAISSFGALVMAAAGKHLF